MERWIARLGSHYLVLGQWGGHSRTLAGPVSPLLLRGAASQGRGSVERERERSGAAGRESGKCAETARKEKQWHPRTAQLGGAAPWEGT